MAIIECADPAVSDAVDRYVQGQKQTGRPISTREAVQALRTALARCYLSDRGLAELVAASAVVHGQNITFDLAATDERATAPRTA
jgi:hypothetical protein